MKLKLKVAEIKPKGCACMCNPMDENHPWFATGICMGVSQVEYFS